MIFSLLGVTSLGAACVAPSWDLQGVTGVTDLDRPLFLALSGIWGDRATQNSINSHLLEMEICRVVVVFLSLEVLTERPVSSFWCKQWFLEHVMHSNTLGGNFLNGEKHGLKN